VKLTTNCDPGIQTSHGNHPPATRTRQIYLDFSKKQINNHTDNVTTRMTTIESEEINTSNEREPKSSTKKTERVKYW
jgi:hypothetical protein